MPDPPIYEFGSFRVDERQHQLFNEGTPVPLPPKVFDTLLALVQRYGEVVGRQELIELVWPGTFVEEAGLTRNISVLRKALAGNESDQRLIETVPKRGYRFAAVVRVVDAPAQTAPPPSADVTPRQRALLAAAAVLVIVVVLTFLSARARAPAATQEKRTAGVANESRLVVLPFENQTLDPSDDWLAGAFSDSLTYGLRHVETLTLVNRERIAEVYQERGVKDAGLLAPQVVRELSRRLAVKYYVHGSYQRVAKEIRVVARLVEADTGQIRGQESVTDRFDNILQVEDRLASRFAAALAPEVPEDTQASGTRSVTAYRAFSEGMTSYLAGRYQEADARVAGALKSDPQYAEAWALGSKIHSRIAGYLSSKTQPQDEHRQAATAAAKRAIEINPSLYDAHLALALAHRDAGRIAEWREEARAAIRLNPRAGEPYAVVADSYNATAQWTCGRDRDPVLAERYYRTALRLDALLANAYLGLAGSLISSNRFEDALAVVDQGPGGIASAPGSPGDESLRARGAESTDR